MTIRWLNRARKDLDDLFSFVAHDSVVNAEREVARLIREVNRLGDHPGLGRPGRVPDTRELVVQPYVVAYRVKDGVVQILRVLHSTRMWPDTI